MPEIAGLRKPINVIACLCEAVTQEFAKASMMWNMTGLSDRVMHQMPIGMTWEAWTAQ